jgi:hypothetical protein
MLWSLRIMGEKLGTRQAFLSGINSSKLVTRTWKMIKDVVIHNITQPKKVLKKCGIWCIQIDVQVSELWLCK